VFNINLKYLRQKHKLSQQVLAGEMNIPRTTLGDYERGKTEPNLEMLVKMSEYFEVKLDDLLRKNLSHGDLEVLRNKDLRVLAITVDSENKGNIELVDTKAEAGYLDSFHDPEYIRELPKISFPSIPEGTYRGFEIQGDSMLPVEPGSMVICSYVEHLDHIKEDRTYIVVSKQEGLVYKRLRHDKQNQQLVLISDNELYLPYTISYSEIAEVWQYYAHLSFSDAKQTTSNKLEEKINDIQRKVSEIHSGLKSNK
jgi:transcriptional regulator with XRE-family HTH domain